MNTGKYGGLLMRHLLNPLDFTTDETEQLLDLASDIAKDPAKYSHKCDGKKIATLFYEPSTRTFDYVLVCPHSLFYSSD